MQDCTNETPVIVPASTILAASELVVPKTGLVLPCPVDMKTGIVVATLEDVSDLTDETAAQHFIEEQRAA